MAVTLSFPILTYAKYDYRCPQNNTEFLSLHLHKEKCNFYSADLSGQFSEFKDVTDNIEEIYYKLARPFQDLENERYSDD